mmetsp:Transcript_43145/g.113325  ORF Transcript_43145/g.113325 Transcript_43145/m.113325 type:complete len:210 (-) Transcript_43145:1119-1748(-)
MSTSATWSSPARFLSCARPATPSASVCTVWPCISSISAAPMRIISTSSMTSTFLPRAGHSVFAVTLRPSSSGSSLEKQSSKEQRVPAPRDEAILNLPPARSIEAMTMGRPRPRPEARPFCTPLTYGLRTFSISSLSMPRPVSTTSMLTRSSASEGSERRHVCTVTWPFSVNLRALERRLSSPRTRMEREPHRTSGIISSHSVRNCTSGL